MTVNVYTNFDAGAPGALPNAVGSMIAVLDACLVSGYGSKPAAGWTKEFNAPNVAVYKQGAGSNGMRARVSDLDGKFARIRGFEVSNSVDAGTGPFPTDAQVNGGDYVFKHDGGAGNRNWVVVADEKSFYFWSLWDTTVNGTQAGITFFGDIKSLKPVDAFATLLMAGSSNGTKNTTNYAAFDHGGMCSSLNFPCFGHYLARSHSQAGASVPAGKQAQSHCGPSGGYNGLSNYGYEWMSNNTSIPLPSEVDGGIYLSPITVSESAAQRLRGFMPGIWRLDHLVGALAPGDTFDVTEGYHAGKKFIVLPVYGCTFCLEISNTW